MGKYRKKPVVIEAIQFDGTDRSFYDIEAMASRSKIGILETCEQGIKIPTLDCVMIASPGDWVILGVKGELYPCKPNVFEVTYEAVDDSSSSKDASSGFQDWPENQPLQYNGSGTPCDMWTGPCACGAWHRDGR